MADLAIVVKDLHKEFVLPQYKNSSLKQAFVHIGRRNIKKRQKVLDGINFEVERGEFFGIVGRNGSGKSTLLKILAGVYAPSSGLTEVYGELTPFIELGVGFNPELTGRDNIYLNGALLGFNRKQMRAMYKDIVEFAELEQFMGQKLKNYSSGMQVRLAFSIAVKAHNDILIFDEVLAVGDEAFQRKCLDVFEQHKANKQTIILVTHDMSTVKKFCSRALLLDKGKITQIGDPRKVANAYSELNQDEIDRDTTKKNDIERESGLKVKILDTSGKPKQSFSLGSKMVVHVAWPELDISNLESLGVNIFKQSGEHITGLNTRYSFKTNDWTKKREIELEFNVDMTKGNYFLDVEAFSQPGKILDALFDGPRFSIVSNQEVEWSGLVELNHRWRDSQ